MRVLRKQYFQESELIKQQQAENRLKKAELDKKKVELMRASLAAEPMKQQQIESVGFKPKTDGEAGEANEATGKEDPIFQERRRMWEEYKLKRDRVRESNYLNKSQLQSNSRLDKLLYLYYSASSFVTYDNIDLKLDMALYDSRLSAPAKAVTRIATELQENYPRETLNTRAAELANAIQGTMVNGQPDVSSIKQVMEEKAESSSQ